MKLSDFFAGSTGLVFSSSCILIILLLMFIMSLRLYLDRRKRAYFSLILSLIIILIYHGQTIYSALHPTPTLKLPYIGHLMQVIAFVMLNVAIYQLYNKTRAIERMVTWTLIIIGCLISYVHYKLNPDLFTPGNPMYNPTYALHNIWLELYLFVLIFLCFWLVSPFIGQNGKYQLSLTIYFFTQAAHISNVYLFQHKLYGLGLVENFMPMIYYGIIFFILFDRVVELLQAVYRSSITDGLTGLFNRKFFFSRVSQYIENQHKVSVIFGDIDNFKKLNDTQGHHRADSVLKQVAEIMTEEAEEIGIVGRYGGEELVILLIEPSAKVEKIAEAIRARVEAESIVTISLGCSRYKKGISPEELVKQADQAMYNSKSAGKNKVSVFNSK